MNRHHKIVKTSSGLSTGKALLNHIIFSPSQTGETVPLRIIWFRGLIVQTLSQGNRTTPSYVAFTDTERLIGDAAKNQVAMNPANTIFGKCCGGGWGGGTNTIFTMFCTVCLSPLAKIYMI
jgi:hypothetical protein